MLWVSEKLRAVYRNGTWGRWLVLPLPSALALGAGLSTCLCPQGGCLPTPLTRPV